MLIWWLLYLCWFLLFFSIVYAGHGKSIQHHYSYHLKKSKEKKALDVTLRAWQQALQAKQRNATSVIAPLLPNDQFKKSLNQDGKSGKKAIVTLLCGGSDDANARYSRFLYAFSYTLRRTQYSGEILVLYTADFDTRNIRKISSTFDLKMKLVPLVSIPNTSHRYAKMLTKLNLWNLIEYEKVIYYDVDFIFQKNPESAFSECGPASLCAVHDQGIRMVPNYEQKSNYFNAGFLVLKPDVSIYRQLVAQQKQAFEAAFVEQDLLNTFFSSWKALNAKYNLMHSYKQAEISRDIVAIHEKLHELKKSFRDQKYIWNQISFVR